jgi:hypothetical protein
MPASIDELTKRATVVETETAIYDIMAAVGVSTTGWFSGAVIRTMVKATAIWISALSALMALIARLGWLETSFGNWLTLVAKHVFGVDRIGASFAAGEITLNNAGGGVFGPFALGDAVFENPTTGKTYTNAEVFSLAALETGRVIEIVALESGSASTSAPGTITKQTFMASVTISNVEAVVGTDEETDANLVIRCLAKRGAASPNGPPDAYSYFARSATLPDGTPCGVTRVRIVKDGFGNVTVYCATATGGITGSTGDPNTPLGAVHEAVNRYAAPLGVTATAASATAVPVPVTYEAQLYNTSGLTNAQIETLILAELVAFMSAEPIGGNEITGPGKLFTSAISAKIGGTRNALGVALPMFRVILAAPAADVPLAANEVPTLSTVTPTIRQVALGAL